VAAQVRYFAAREASEIINVGHIGSHKIPTPLPLLKRALETVEAVTDGKAKEALDLQALALAEEIKRLCEQRDSTLGSLSNEVMALTKEKTNLEKTQVLSPPQCLV
jgi:hypothetical protein